MDDEEILELYFARNESAVTETNSKYGNFLRYISFNILRNLEDSEECVNDTYLKVWSAIPPKKPSVLSAFLGKITRNLSLDKLRILSAEKRGKGQIEICLEEISYCVSSFENEEKKVIDSLAIRNALNLFLSSLSKEKRKIFMKRYFYFCSVGEIAKEMEITESKVKMSLMRSREKLKECLESEGIIL